MKKVFTDREVIAAENKVDTLGFRGFFLSGNASHIEIGEDGPTYEIQVHGDFLKQVDGDDDGIAVNQFSLVVDYESATDLMESRGCEWTELDAGDIFGMAWESWYDVIETESEMEDKKDCPHKYYVNEKGERRVNCFRCMSYTSLCSDGNCDECDAFRCAAPDCD